MSGSIGAPLPDRAEAVLGERVRELRRARGWSQDELARRMRSAGFSWLQSTVAKTEAADRPIRVDEAASLATILGVDIADLIRPAVHPSAQRIQQLTAEKRVLESDYLSKRNALWEVDEALNSVNAQLEALQFLSGCLAGEFLRRIDG